MDDSSSEPPYRIARTLHALGLVKRVLLSKCWTDVAIRKLRCHNFRQQCLQSDGPATRSFASAVRSSGPRLSGRREAQNELPVSRWNLTYSRDGRDRQQSDYTPGGHQDGNELGDAGDLRDDNRPERRSARQAHARVWLCREIQKLSRNRTPRSAGTYVQILSLRTFESAEPNGSNQSKRPLAVPP